MLCDFHFCLLSGYVTGIPRMSHQLPLSHRFSLDSRHARRANITTNVECGALCVPRFGRPPSSEGLVQYPRPPLLKKWHFQKSSPLRHASALSQHSCATTVRALWNAMARVSNRVTAVTITLPPLRRSRNETTLAKHVVRVGVPAASWSWRPSPSPSVAASVKEHQEECEASIPFRNVGV